MHARRRRRVAGSSGGNSLMSPMIDMVFLLLIYFLLTFAPQDLVAHLGANTPAPQPGEGATKPLLMITVEEDGYSILGARLSAESLEEKLQRLSIDPDQAVILLCRPESRHENMVRALDTCLKVGMNNLSVISGK